MLEKATEFNRDSGVRCDRSPNATSLEIVELLTGHFDIHWVISRWDLTDSEPAATSMRGLLDLPG